MIPDSQALTDHLPKRTGKGDHLGACDFGRRSSCLLLNTLFALTTRLRSPKLASCGVQGTNKPSS